MNTRPRVYFQTKVLFATVLVMALLLASLMVVVNARFSTQFSEQTKQKLSSARSVFLYQEVMRARKEQAQYAHVVEDLGVRQMCTQTLGDEGLVIRKTFDRFLQDLIERFGADLALYTTEGGALLASAAREGAKGGTGAFSAANRSIEKAAREGEINVDTIPLGDKVFDVVSIPVPVSGGVLTFGNEVGTEVAKEVRRLTRSEIAFVSNGRVSVSTFRNRELFPTLLANYNAFLSSGARGDAAFRRVRFLDEHFLCLAVPFRSLSGDESSGCLLLSSYEEALQELSETQRMLLLGGLIAILLGSFTVWLIVRKLAQPLRELREGAEAVGRGDFSILVPVSSRDECGLLAQTFNRMTENIRKSHEDLEQTVETLKTTQAQLVQREKLSAMGEFVSGVAHELNNPLTAVIGFAELLKQIDLDPKHSKYLDTIVAGAQRCHKIIQSLLSFARQRPVERKLADVNELLESTLTFMQYELRTSNVEVQREFTRPLPFVSADSHQLQQVFLNMVNNARQAMEANQGGWLRICSDIVGGRVRITIGDNGPGIAPENLPKLFTPFFTTKEVGKGTGLGLSVSYGLIREHGGTIHVESKVGKGTTFLIDLPVCADAPPASPAEKPPMSQAEERVEGVGKKVLVIDDEESVLELIYETLTASGYYVDVAQDGEAGLKRLRQETYDLTLCDLKMPGLNGQQVYERLARTDPKAADRLVFMSGDLASDQTQHFFAKHKNVCLAKPFSLAEFKKAVAKMSDSKA